MLHKRGVENGRDLQRFAFNLNSGRRYVIAWLGALAVGRRPDRRPSSRSGQAQNKMVVPGLQETNLVMFALKNEWRQFQFSAHAPGPSG